MIFFCQKQLFFKFFVFYSTATLFKNDGHIKKKGGHIKSTFTLFHLFNIFNPLESLL